MTLLTMRGLRRNRLRRLNFKPSRKFKKKSIFSVCYRRTNCLNRRPLKQSKRNVSKTSRLKNYTQQFLLSKKRIACVRSRQEKSDSKCS
jgi:hypothetical protein